MTFEDLRKSNSARHREWARGESLPLSFRGLELGGEAGEACNEIKKIERIRCQALLKMGAISPELYEQSTAAHPSIVLRTQVIRQVVNQPEQASKFHRRFRSEQQIAAACLVALVVFAVLVGQII